MSDAVKLESILCQNGEEPDYTSVTGQVAFAKRLNVVRKILDGLRRQGEWSAIKTSIGAVRRVASNRYSKINQAVDTEERREHGSGRNSGPLLSGTAYCLSSCCMIMLNKVVLSSYSFNAGISLMFYQNLISTLIVGILGFFGAVTVEKLNWKLVKVWIPVNLIFIGMLVSGMYSLKYINIAMVTILKNVTNILTAIGELYIFGKRQNQKVWTAMFVMIISAVFGGITDLSFDATGYAWQSVNCVLTASYSLTLRRVMDRAKQFTESGSLNEVSMVLLNNGISIPFAIILIFLFDEWSYIINAFFPFLFHFQGCRKDANVLGCCNSQWAAWASY
ncbi:GDP-mannose transporter GONST2 isoform X4 [Capsicum annuum]|uniref:GDP-mannose transporter GONST2 isoform X4 n=1 Tax=Capsicum annuum TaxID=4072 RepID=UPI001FB167F0|nr:GDP-mannose transporter GONST2 isoform X4 [Capsicum annuum]XP_016577708.2 GDP-mannose transporter GONST2 isoform X4 [Capsicum annuum]